MRVEEIILHKDRNVSLTALLQDTGGEFTGIEKRPAVIVLPGGGYSMCSDREADPVALAFAKEGFQTFILRYTVSATDKAHIWPHPIEDYDEAFDLIRANAEKWGVDMERVATCGFSAGGHLAACTATMARNRPAAAILGYPALLPGVVEGCIVGAPYPVEHIDRKTPPCFIFIARDDGIVNVKNATAFADALEDNGIMFELHVYSYGNHGFSTGLSYLNTNPLSQRAKNWVQDAVGFLGEVWGQFTTNGFTKPEIRRTVNGNFEDYLSTDCTVAFLESQGEPAMVVLREALDGINAFLTAAGYSGNAALYLKSVLTLKAVLLMTGGKPEQVTELDEKLTAIPTKFKEVN